MQCLLILPAGKKDKTLLGATSLIMVTVPESRYETSVNLQTIKLKLN